MNEKNKKLLYNLFVIGIGTIFTRLISFVMTPFYSSWLTTEEYGQYDLIATYVSLCVPFVTLQLDQAVYRFSIENKKYSNYYYKISAKFMLPLICIISVIVYCFMDHIGFEKNIILSFIGYFISMAYYNITAEYLRGNGKLIEYSAINLTMGILSVLLSIIFLRVFRLGVVGLLLVYACAYGITFFISQILYKPCKVKNKNDTKISSLLRYSIPLIPNNISWWITNVSDRTLINLMIGNYYNGVYAICCKIPTMLSIIFGIFNLSFQQVALQHVTPDEQKPYFSALIKNVVRILFSGSILIVSFTPWIYHLFLKKDYWEGIICVPVLLCGAVFLSIAQYMGDILLVKKDTKSIGGSTICAAIINIVLNIFTIPSWGILGASFATMISYIVMFIIRFRATIEFLNPKELVKYIITYSTIYLVLSILVILTMNNNVMSSFVTLAICLIFVLINKDIIKSVFSKFHY